MSYSKLAFTLIKNWLLKNGCTLSKEAVSTESLYFTYKDKNIRLSTHIGRQETSDYVSIVVPINNVHSFGIFVERYFTIYYSLNDLKDFLKSIFLLINIGFINNVNYPKILESKLAERDSTIKVLKNNISELRKENGQLKQERNNDRQLKKTNNELKDKVDKLTKKTKNQTMELNRQIKVIREYENERKKSATET
jgi:FtsZ-binding cell division protein ZapB